MKKILLLTLLTTLSAHADYYYEIAGSPFNQLKGPFSSIDQCNTAKLSEPWYTVLIRDCFSDGSSVDILPDYIPPLCAQLGNCPTPDDLPFGPQPYPTPGPSCSFVDC